MKSLANNENRTEQQFIKYSAVKPSYYFRFYIDQDYSETSAIYLAHLSMNFSFSIELGPGSLEKKYFQNKNGANK